MPRHAQDCVDKLKNLARTYMRNVCVLAATGTLSSATLAQVGSSGQVSDTHSPQRHPHRPTDAPATTSSPPALAPCPCFAHWKCQAERQSLPLHCAS